MAEQKLPKLTTRVRFPSPAPMWRPAERTERKAAAMRLRIILLASLASAAMPGLAARPGPAALIVTGTLTAGDAPNGFTEMIDLRTGHNKHVEQMGPSVRQYGFDGQPWSAAGGILMISNLPTAVARGATMAWMDPPGWRRRDAGTERI